MPTSTITNTVTGPSGTALANIPVKVSLYPKGAFRISDSSEVATQVFTTTNASGVWSLALEQTANISPANSYYVVEEQIPQYQGGARSYAFQVGAVNTTLLASLISVLPDLPANTYLTQAAADARYVQSPGSFATVGNISDSRPADASAAGVLSTYARGDHKHSRETISGTAAARAALAGTDTGAALSFNETDTFKWFKRLGSAWLQYLVTHIGLQSAKPATNFQGQPYYVTDATNITGTGVYTPDTTSQPAVGDNVWYQNAAGRWQYGEWGKPWGIVGYKEVTANQGSITTLVDLTSLTITFTAAANRRYRIKGKIELSSTVGDGAFQLFITDSTPTTYTRATGPIASTAGFTVFAETVESFAAGTITIKLRLERTSGTGTYTMGASATSPAFILIEDIGPNGAPA